MPRVKWNMLELLNSMSCKLLEPVWACLKGDAFVSNGLRDSAQSIDLILSLDCKISKADHQYIWLLVANYVGV